MKIKMGSTMGIIGKGAQIDNVTVGTITEVEFKQEMDSLPVITLQIVTNQECMANLMDYLYMAGIMEGSK